MSKHGRYAEYQETEKFSHQFAFPNTNAPHVSELDVADVIVTVVPDTVHPTAPPVRVALCWVAMHTGTE